MTTGWLPAPDPAALRRAAGAVLADARALAADSDEFSVHLDVALAEHEFGRDGADPDAGAGAARRAFGRAAELLRATRDVGPWLYGGAAHAGWTALAIGLPPRTVSGVDRVVESWVGAFPPDGDVDLPCGAVGLGVYALSHPDPGLRERVSAAVLDVVEDRAEHDADGLFVRLPASPQREAEGSAGAATVGVAHGAAGLVAYLASVSAAGLRCSPRARAVLASAVRWLLRQRVAPEVGGSAGGWRVTGYQPYRSTWCYGDPGIALSLSVAARVTGSPAIRDAAADLAGAALSRPPSGAGVVDACLCHGAAGLAWIGHRLHALDGSRSDAARYAGHWSAHVVAARGRGPLQYVLGRETGRTASFLDGDVGVALCLLHVATGRRPVWEQKLLAGRVRPTVVDDRPAGQSSGACGPGDVAAAVPS